MVKLFILIFISTTIGCSNNSFKKNKKEPDIKKSNSASIFVDNLESLGYFKYANKKDIDKLKDSIKKHFNPERELSTIYDERNFTPLDFRLYLCDGEYVYEKDGFVETINEMKPTFKKIGFNIEIQSHFEEWDKENDWLNHHIKINGTNYTIFKNFKGFGWGEAVQRLAEILNTELEKQKVEERIYLISNGNDGSLIFLNKELYQYIYGILKNPYWKPLEVSEWKKVMGIKPMN